MLDELKKVFQRKNSLKSVMELSCENSYRLQGVIQAKVEVGHRVWNSWVLDPKLPNSKNVYMIRTNKRA